MNFHPDQKVNEAFGKLSHALFTHWHLTDRCGYLIYREIGSPICIVMEGGIPLQWRTDCKLVDYIKTALRKRAESRTQAPVETRPTSQLQGALHIDHLVDRALIELDDQLGLLEERRQIRSYLFYLPFHHEEPIVSVNDGRPRDMAEGHIVHLSETLWIQTMAYTAPFN